MTACPCGGKAYATCCEPFHRGERWPESAELLMRSRYSAYALAAERPGCLDYLFASHHPRFRDRRPQAHKELTAWVQQVNFTRLEVLETRAGQPGDKQGKVTFKAHYEVVGESAVMHEQSRFRPHAGRWMYCDGKMLN